MASPYHARGADRLASKGYEFVKSKNAKGETVYRTEKAGTVSSAKHAG